MKLDVGAAITKALQDQRRNDRIQYHMTALLEDQEALAYELWLALGDGTLPHDGRQLPPDEVLAWECPQCEVVINEMHRTEAPPCTIDWRWALHKQRYIKAVESLSLTRKVNEWE